MKKTLSIVLSLIMVITMLPAFAISAFAASQIGYCGSNVNYEVSDNENELIITGSGAMYDYNIDTKDVPPWYNYQKYIKVVIIEDGVTNIGNDTFCNFDNLEEVRMADSVTSVGSFAFNWCASLKNVTFSNNLQTIGAGAFTGCESLTSVDLPDSLRTIDTAAFNYAGIQTLYVPEGVTTIGETAFGGIPDVYYEGNAVDTAGDNWGAQNFDPYGGHEYRYYITPATMSKNGKQITKCYYCGKVRETKAIAKIASVNLSTTKYTYDGKVKTPSVTIKDANGKALVKNTDYSLSYSSGRKNAGKYSVKVTFKGKYEGTVTKTFTIVPKGTTISSLTAVSKGFTVKWKKQATQTTGYQIQIATDSKFTKGVKNYTVTKNSTVSKKITKLKAKKKYYVRIRTYKTVSGTKYYSSWSAKKYVTTKK